MPERERTAEKSDNRTNFEKLRGLLEGRDKREVKAGECACHLELDTFDGKIGLGLRLSGVKIRKISKLVRKD
jgi:hypothetical protein